MPIKWSNRLISIFSLTSLVAAIPVQAAPYEIIDLGNLGGVSNYSYSINELNEVTGSSDGQIIPNDEADEEDLPAICQLPNGETVYQEFCSHAYLYSNSVIIDLGDFAQDQSFGFAINDNSAVVGYAHEEIDDGDEETTNVIHERAFISFAGGLIEALPFPDEANELAEGIYPQQRALDITNDRKIVGLSYIPLTNDDEETFNNYRPFLYDYDTGSMTILPLFTDDAQRTGGARAINSSSVIVGWAESDEENNPIHAMLWDPASPESAVDLGTLGGFTSKAYDINDGQIIVGVSETSESYVDNQSLGFVYDPNAETPMIAIPEFSDSENFRTSLAYAINNNNQIVGTAQIKEGYSQRNTAFLYDFDNDSLTNLNDMVDCSLNWELQIARDINDSGVITGIGTIDDEVHSFLLVPTADTEPTNCTELRDQEREEENQQDSGSGSGSGLLLLLVLSVIGKRRLVRA